MRAGQTPYDPETTRRHSHPREYARLLVRPPPEQGGGKEYCYCPKMLVSLPHQTADPGAKLSYRLDSHCGRHSPSAYYPDNDARLTTRHRLLPLHHPRLTESIC